MLVPTRRMVLVNPKVLRWRCLGGGAGGGAGSRSKGLFVLAVWFT